MASKQFDRKEFVFTGIFSDTVLAPATGDRLYVKSVEVGNSVGSAQALGWGYKLPNAMWKAGQWDDSETASYIEDTTHAQDSTVNNFALTTTTNNDGIVVAAMEPFNVIGIDVGTAGGSAPTLEYTYWNGSSWATLNTFKTPDLTNTSAYQYLVFHTPGDWDVTAAGDTPVDTDTVPAGYYAVRIRATGAPSTTAANGDSIWVGVLKDFVEEVDDGKSIEWTAASDAGLRIPGGAALTPFCETANAGNWVLAEYRYSV